MFLQMAQDAHNWTLVAELSTMIHHNKGRFNDFNISNASAGQWAGTPNNTLSISYSLCSMANGGTSNVKIIEAPLIIPEPRLQ